ncbi:hypothetical protein G9F32_13115 [Acinetobacter sp. 194]|uniref:hypothetical protein n=1 Tax=Acinetobacter shaoyimingii TaxID=2715164 RepID=UPI00140D007D|nr:hypothetical protein [Acinetobacter shaoyimingii]NHB58950.1 hypothetical protein [Acinetobacter shaoyimingii]
MKTLSKTILIAILTGFAAHSVNAEEITFHGNIAEFSCSQDSLDKDCKDVAGLVNRLKNTESSLKLTQLVNGNTQRAAKLSIQDIDNKEHKVLVVNYN